MQENEEQEAETCGGKKKPTYNGSPNPGDWDCQGNDWVWIEDIGGK